MIWRFFHNLDEKFSKIEKIFRDLRECFAGKVEENIA